MKLFASAGILGLFWIVSPGSVCAIPTNIFLENPVGPRHLAMGSTGVSSATGPNSTWWNPSNLAFLRQSGLATSYALLDIDARAYDLRLALSPGPQGLGYGLSWSQTNFNNVTQTEILLDASGGIIIDPNTGLPEKRVIGFSSESDNLFTGSLGLRVADGFAIGTTGKAIYGVLGGITGKGFGGDVGFSGSAGRFSFGSVYKNVGLTIIEWTDGFVEQLPSGIQAEVGFSIGNSFSSNGWGLGLALSTWIPRTPEGEDPTLRGGMEWNLSPVLALRFGFNGDQLTGGAGFKMGDLIGDYAFAPNALHNAVHRLAVSFLWGRKSGESSLSPSIRTKQLLPQLSDLKDLARSIEPSLEPPPDEVSNEALDLLDSAKTERALEVFLNGLKVFGSDAALWHGAAKAYLSMGLKKEGLFCIEQVLILKPDHVELKNWLERQKP